MIVEVTPSPRRHALLVVGWVGALCVTWWLLAQSARGDLASPPVGSLADARAWARNRDEAELTIVMLRLVGQTLVLYLLWLSVAGAVIRLVPDASPKFLDRLSPGWLVRLLDSSLGFGLAAALGLATITVPAVEQSGPPSVRELQAGDVEPRPAGGSADPMVIAPVDAGPMIMRPLNVPRSEAAEDGSALPARAVSGASPEQTSLPSSSHTERNRMWTTEPGEHLWLIARETLVDDLGTEPTSAQIDRYWRRLVEHNRDRLLDPANPDLIIPGQEFELPTVR